VPGRVGDWDALVRPGPSAPEGTLLTGEGGLEMAVGDRMDGGRRRVKVLGGDPVAALAHHGEAPLPPYLAGLRVDADRPLSTSVHGPLGGWRGTEGGLALDAEAVEACRRQGAAVATVELVVSGAPTGPEDAELPAERYRVPAESLRAASRARRVLAVGAPCVRALEAAAATNRLEGETRLLIVPGHPWKVVDALLATFAPPRSAALLAVEALVGARWHGLYGIGLAGGYRFGPLGDTVLLQRIPAP